MDAPLDCYYIPCRCRDADEDVDVDEDVDAGGSKLCALLFVLVTYLE